ncbi:DUF7146 domain-containing protein [Mameliella alba]
MKRKEAARAEAAKKSAKAKGLWREAQPITGTIAEAYMLEARGITCALPDTLRFHPSCWHGPSASRQPAFIVGLTAARAERLGSVCVLHCACWHCRVIVRAWAGDALSR